MVLAILATIGGFVGISTAFTGGEHKGGKLNIVTWLNPIIWNPETKAFNSSEPHESTAAKPHEGGEAVPASEGFNLAHAVESTVHSETATEWVFIIISLVVAGCGIGLGFLFYIKRPQLADVWAARLGPLYKASYTSTGSTNSGLAITRAVMDLARGVFTFDSKVVDNEA